MDLRDHQVHSSYRRIHSSELKWPWSQCHNAMQSKKSKCQWWVTKRTIRTMNQPRFLTLFHYLFWATQSPIINDSLISFSSPFKGSLYLQQGYWYSTPSLTKHFSDYWTHLIHNNPKVIHTELQYVPWHSHTIQPCLSSSHLQIKQTLPSNTSLHVGDMVLSKDTGQQCRQVPLLFACWWNPEV